jgi:tRNA 2-thiocytidine biosynthesis protein TtcA
LAFFFDDWYNAAMSARSKYLKDLPALVGVSRKVGQAIMDFGMINAGDRIAVAVSGGKDSISLLHVLRHRRSIAPIDFEFIAVHVDFEFDDFDPSRLIAYFKQHEFPHMVVPARDAPGRSLLGNKYEEVDCYRWSAARRKALFEVCRCEGFNKIAFGHHMDDIVETILLNQFYRGEFGAMKPKQELFDGKITLIRPLAYVREESMAFLAKNLGIESIGGQSKCANDDTSHRMLIKKMLRDLEARNPSIVKNIFKSVQNIKTEYLIERAPQHEPAR